MCIPCFLFLFAKVSLLGSCNPKLSFYDIHSLAKKKKMRGFVSTKELNGPGYPCQKYKRAIIDLFSIFLSASSDPLYCIQIFVCIYK